MFEIADTGEPPDYARLQATVAAIVEGEADLIANMANVASVLWHSLPDINWAGFYRAMDGELVLGPFHGKPACIRIAFGRGVCGAAAERRRSVLVHDVEQFPGHIACDAASRSELVVPLVRDGVLLGVLDIDSPTVGRFTEDDREGCEGVVQRLLGQE